MLYPRRFAGAVVLTASFFAAAAHAEIVPPPATQDVAEVSTGSDAVDHLMQRGGINFADERMVPVAPGVATAGVASRELAAKLAGPVAMPVSSLNTAPHATTNPAMIPLPPAVWTGLIGLGLIAAVSATRKFRHML